MTFPDDIQIEREKYLCLTKTKRYAKKTHAEPFLDYIKSLNIKSLIEVGCGRTIFTKWASENGIKDIWAADLAFKLPDMSHLKDFFECHAGEIPLKDNMVEYVASFDVLEHIHTYRVQEVLEEFSRISTKGALFTIATRMAKHKLVGILHLTVKSLEWWIEQIYDFYKPSIIQIIKGGLLHCVK